LTVTPAIPLPPVPLSLAQPLSVTVPDVTVWFEEWLVIASAGIVASRTMVICNVRVLPPTSLAITVSELGPFTSVTGLLHVAVAPPTADPPAGAPLTVTLVTPFPPIP
jgi:hypothetical protein